MQFAKVRSIFFSHSTTVSKFRLVPFAQSCSGYKAAMTLSRAHDIVSAKANKALDSAENPNEILDYSYQQMLDQGRRPAI